MRLEELLPVGQHVFAREQRHVSTQHRLLQARLRKHQAATDHMFHECTRTKCIESAHVLEVVGVFVEQAVDDFERFVVLLLRAEQEREEVLRVDVVGVEADGDAHLMQRLVDLRENEFKSYMKAPTCI